MIQILFLLVVGYMCHAVICTVMSKGSGRPREHHNMSEEAGKDAPKKETETEKQKDATRTWGAGCH